MIPTLFVGIGTAGRDVVSRTQAALRETFSQLLPAVRTVGIDQPVKARVDEQGVTVPSAGGAAAPSGADEDLLFPCEEVSASWFEQHQQEFQTRCKALTDEWLAARTLRQVVDAQSNACDLLFVASLQEPLGAALALKAAEALRQHVTASYTSVAVRAEVVLLLPEGACDEGATIHHALRRLADAARAETSPFEMAYLLCPANGAGVRLSDEELRGLCAQFLLLRTVSDLSQRLRRPEFDFGREGRLGALGLSVLEFPAHMLVRRLSRHYGKRLVEQALLTSDPQTEAAKQAAEALTEARHLQAGQEQELLKCLLVSQTPRGERRLEDELTVGAFVFAEVPRRRWHIALATFDVFFRRERFGRVLGWLEENAQRLREELVSAIKSKVDETVEGNRDPDNALAFLAELNRLLDEMRKHFFTVGEVRRIEAPGAQPVHALEGKLDALRQAVASIPEWAPIIVKALLLTLLLALPVQVILNNLVPQQGDVFAWLSAPAQWAVALLLPAVPAFLAGWWTIQKATERAWQVANECARLIEERYKSQLREQAQARLREVLDALFLLTLDTQTLRRDYPDYTGDNECREVERLKEHIQALPQVLAEEEAEERAGWRVNVMEWAQPPPVFAYQQNPDFNDWEGECQRLIESGFLKGWRQISARELAGKVMEFTKGGVAYILRITLDNFISKHVLDRGDVHQILTQLYNQMFARGKPFLLVQAEGMETLPQPLPALSQPESSILKQRLAATGGLRDTMEQTMSCAHPYEFALLQLAHHVSVDGLLALAEWRKMVDG